jgi:hypothetical protein
METEWVLDVNCPRKDNFADEPTTRVCAKCTYKIWDYSAAAAAGLNSSMCSTVVGNKDVTEQLDLIAEKLTGKKRFTKKEGNPSSKREILEKIRTYAKLNGWNISGLSPKQTITRLDTLIEYCKRVEAKGLNIWVWK